MKSLLILLLASSAFAAPMKYKAADGSGATFEAVGHPSLLKINGKGAKLTGDLVLDGAKATGDFVLDLTGFDTGIETRTEHMKEKYLETGKFPKAYLTVTKVDLPAGFKPGDAADAAFTGNLKLKDVTKPVTGHVKISGGAMATTADFSFKLSDYPVGVPKYMGITVADDVKVIATIPSFAKE